MGGVNPPRCVVGCERPNPKPGCELAGAAKVGDARVADWRLKRAAAMSHAHWRRWLADAARAARQIRGRFFEQAGISCYLSAHPNLLRLRRVPEEPSMPPKPLRAPPAEEPPLRPFAAGGPHPRLASEEDPRYPSSDGQPMADNDWQLWAMVRLISTLGNHYRRRADVQVGGNQLIYYQEGKAAKRVAPDVYVAFGVPKRKRMVYKVWEEAKAPDFVLEVASRSTWRKDRNRKRRLYAKLGVREFWLFDPQGKFFDPPLDGFILQGGNYHPLPVRLENGERVLRSRVLELDLIVRGEELRLRDPATGKFLRNLEEAEEDRDRETTARHKAEARVAELETEIKALRADSTAS